MVVCKEKATKGYVAGRDPNSDSIPTLTITNYHQLLSMEELFDPESQVRIYYLKTKLIIMNKAIWDYMLIIAHRGLFT